MLPLEKPNTRFEDEDRKIARIQRYLSEQPNVPTDKREAAERKLMQLLFKSKELRKLLRRCNPGEHTKGNLGISRTGKLFRKGNSWKPKKKKQMMQRKRKFTTVFGQKYFA